LGVGFCALTVSVTSKLNPSTLTISRVADFITSSYLRMFSLLPLPFSRKSQLPTIIVHRESTISSTNKTEPLEIGSAIAELFGVR
jgi:hypothetical protein